MYLEINIENQRGVIYFESNILPFSTLNYEAIVEQAYYYTDTAIDITSPVYVNLDIFTDMHLRTKIVNEYSFFLTPTEVTTNILTISNRIRIGTVNKKHINKISYEIFNENGDDLGNIKLAIKIKLEKKTVI